MFHDAADDSSGADSISLILVVEDDLTANRLGEMLVRPEGAQYEITRVLRVEDALLKLQEGSHDVMLIDLSVHEGFGLDSLMRASAATRSIPIVVLTYQRDEATALKAARAGAQDYLTKGEVSPDLLSRTLIHAIERHRILQDLTKAQQRQRFLATHDSLTELPNRYWFMEQLKLQMSAAERHARKLAVMFFDLDGFKAINDNLGHAVGDELLTDVARRLRKNIRKCDLVARIGGDEFLAAIQDVKDEESPMAVAEQIRRDIEKPYHVAGSECWISASVGIAIYPNHGRSADKLIQSADTAMYAVKTSGKNRVSLFSREMNDKAAERYELVNSLREAIHNGQLSLMYQPQIDAVGEEIIGVETLVRWNHPSLGTTSPADFIEIAEETGVMVQLGEWVLRTACADAAGWRHLSTGHVAVNISGRQIESEDFVGRVLKILEETGLSPARLELELTESLAANASTLRVVEALRAEGIRVAIDDFGTGYSSLTLLKQLNVDVLKIDQSFVRGAAWTDPDRVILEGMILIARGLGLEVIAEGVESLEEMRALLDRGCTRMQGYLFSKPVDRQHIDEVIGGARSAWRIPLVDPDAWTPLPVEEPSRSGAASGAEIGRIGLRSGGSGGMVDPDEHLYPALKKDVD